MTWLVISDLDGTLLGDDAALAEFAAWRRAAGQRVALAYSSGRSFASVLASIRTTALPEPVAVIGNVGTQIGRYPDGAALCAWPVIEGDAWCARRVRRALADFPGLAPQPDEFQSPHKVSYFLHDAEEEHLQELHDRLRAARLAADVVYSSRRDLDVLPAGANKGTAARCLARTLGVAHDRVIVCGDSGNDAAMFLAGFRGVIVGNALAELKALAGDRAYQARAPMAGGVLEGLRHWLAEK